MTTHVDISWVYIFISVYSVVCVFIGLMLLRIESNRSDITVRDFIQVMFISFVPIINLTAALDIVKHYDITFKANFSQVLDKVLIKGKR